MKKGKLFLVVLMLLSCVAIPFSFYENNKIKAESFEGSTNTYVAYWYEAWNPERFLFDSRMTNGEQVRDSQPTEQFWNEFNEIIDAGYIKIPDYITSVDQVEFELVFKPAHVQDPQTVRNEDDTIGLQIMDNYMGTGERRLRIPVVSIPSIARTSSVIHPYGSSGRAYKYDTKITYRVNFELEEKAPEPEEREGQVVGKVYWELQRTDPNKASEVYVESDFRIASEHYAIRNIGHAVSFGGMQKKSAGEAIKINQSETNMEIVRGQEIDYIFHYQYTNSPIGTVCSGSGDDEYCWWDGRPDWSQVEQFILHDTLQIDHKQFDRVGSKDETIDDVLLEQSPVGKSDTWNYPVKERKDYFEQWRKAASNQVKNHYQLKTQTTVPITPGALELLIELPSGEHKKSTYFPFGKELASGYNFPVDVDDSLKEDYKNPNTKNHMGYPYAFPLQQNVAKDKGMEGEKRVFEIDFTTDMFFVTKHTGFITGTPYTEKVREHLTNGAEIPSESELIDEGVEKIQSEYEKTFSVPFYDEVLYVDP